MGEGRSPPRSRIQPAGTGRLSVAARRAVTGGPPDRAAVQTADRAARAGAAGRRYIGGGWRGRLQTASRLASTMSPLSSRLLAVLAAACCLQLAAAVHTHQEYFSAPATQGEAGNAPREVRCDAAVQLGRMRPGV